MKYTRPYRQAVELQQLIMRDARVPELKPLVRAHIARSFCELEECKRKLRNKPLVKPVDASTFHKPKPVDTTFAES